MQRDFTLEKYRLLLESLKKKGYSFVTYAEYAAGEAESVALSAGREERFLTRKGQFFQRNAFGRNDKTQRAMPLPLCILRHDVDLLPGNALITARVEKKLGISGTYYFRTTPEVFNAGLIKEIESLGHEIGYHYETMDSSSGNIDKAYEEFCKNLEMFRKITPVKTICMHGSPLSEFDNKGIWAKYSYKDLGIIGEPYFDIDWHQFAYLTDTGRRWDGAEVSVRDKVDSKYIFNFKKTRDIIDNINSLPDKMMITIHPQRWTNDILPWTKELVLQNIKNVVKRIIAKRPAKPDCS